MKAFCYQRKIEDWRRKTSRLSLEQRGIYSELIDWYYCTGGDLPADLDELCRMIGATKRSEKQNVKEVINNTSLFTVDKNRLVQKMCDETLNFMTQKSFTNSENSKSRWNKNNNLSNANALQSNIERKPNYQLSTNNYKLSDSDDDLNGKKIKKIQISLDALQRAKSLAVGWDVYALENAFLAFAMANERPKNPDAAFLAWVPKYIRDRKP